ncbi:MAG: hypothetical protein K2F74_02960, partial [Muribaculaceae bacterium]|nr:hypothetical protein [Muribaculaceae bacterium]
RDRRHDDRRPSRRKDTLDATDIQPDSENPLAARRNPYALRSITGKTPSLPRPEGPIMRSRGWKKK